MCPQGPEVHLAQVSSPFESPLQRPMGEATEENITLSGMQAHSHHQPCPYLQGPGPRSR
jgi:hypothetical protein